MSLYAQASGYVRKRIDKDLTMVKRARFDRAADAAGSPPPSPPQEEKNRFDALTKYVPTETITLYVAAISAQSALQSCVSFLTATFLYWLFAALTPLILFLIYLGKSLHAGVSKKAALASPPVWRMIAGTLAFLAWAIAVPGGPYLNISTEQKIIASFLALFASTILSLFGSIFEKA